VTPIPLCAGCHFGGSLGGSDGIQGIVYHDNGGTVDINSLSRAAPVVGLRVYVIGFRV
jgi:hypothetical protein